jgi:dTDP-glucose 4,6-dehydratase
MAFARVIDALLAEGGSRSTGPTSSRVISFVDDAVSATIAAMEAGSSRMTYNVGGSETTLNDAIEQCQELAGTELDVINEATARGDVRRTGADTTLIRTELGWRPETPLARGLALQLEAARAAVGTIG